MFKRFVLMIALAFTTHLVASAAYSIVIHGTDGIDDMFLLSTKPKLSFDDSDLIIKTEKKTLAIARKDVKNIDFSEVQDGISDIESGTVIELIANDIFRFNIADGKGLGVYDLSGRQVSAVSKVVDSDYTTLSLASCPAGIYIIVYNNKSFKFIKK